MLDKIEKAAQTKNRHALDYKNTTNKMALSNASSQTLSAPGSPALLGATPTWDPRINPNPEWLHLDGMLGMEHLAAAAIGSLAGTPPGSPRPDTGPAPRQDTWSIAYGNPPPWLAAVPLTRSNALRISTHQDFTAEELDYGWPSIMTPRAGAYRPHFMEPLTTGSSAVASPIDRGVGADGHIGGIVPADYYPGLMPLPSPPAEPFVPQEPAILPPSTPIPGEQ